MTFKKNHKLGALPFNDEPFDTSPVCFKVKKGVKDKLKAVPGWQERLRETVDKLIESIGE
ncbi:MAG: hypothetical protein KME54_28140 [Tolypothrix brevis GSE-NOS-MK-07-07A]|jgi:hypothetical protein|nr:hypothetical protein [Tolypothrix brevis GSE-NOS-MK-07-07A]